MTTAERFRKLEDALTVEAQLLDRHERLDEERHARIDGGWMRGFGYSLWEYYGSNADQAWSAYCMETGWTNAIIALALYLMDDTFFEPRPA